MNLNQQKGIALQIDETINTLQLRLELNEKAINTRSIRSTYVEDGLDFIHAINCQKHQTNSVIEECKASIEKLLLLKRALSSLPAINASRLFNNCEKYSLEHFQQQLRIQQNC